ncbi:MAG: hypothetical protein ACOYM3_03740 [Terrimicrobiaceae bacterium]
MKSLPALLILCLFLASCATAPAPTPLVLQRLAVAGVDSRTYAKIHAGRVLSYSDIEGLVQDKIPDAAIVSYLKSTHAPYRLTDAQLDSLSNSGAGSDLVNYLGKSVGYYEATKRAQTGGDKWDNHPYFNNPYYLGGAPFPYAYPGEWSDPAMLGMWF